MNAKTGSDSARNTLAPQDLDDLCEALLLLKDRDEARNFLIDLCTPAELKALSERWVIARILDQGQASYRDISAQTGASTTTVGRVARFLEKEGFQGYRLILDRLRHRA
jgi:TrpR-related protein YerC/YecD